MFFAPSNTRQRAKIQIMNASKTNDLIKIKIKMPNLIHEPSASSKVPNQDMKNIDVLCTFKFKIENQNSEHGCIKDQYNAKFHIKMPNPSQEPPTGLKRIWMFFSPSKLRQRAKIWNMDASKNSDHTQIKIKMPITSQELPASFKVPNQDSKDLDVFCTFKINIEHQTLEQGCLKDQ